MDYALLKGGFCVVTRVSQIGKEGAFLQEAFPDAAGTQAKSLPQPVITCIPQSEAHI